MCYMYRCCIRVCQKKQDQILRDAFVKYKLYPLFSIFSFSFLASLFVVGSRYRKCRDHQCLSLKSEFLRNPCDCSLLSSLRSHSLESLYTTYTTFKSSSHHSMTLLSLPTELLTEICRRVSSSSDLYHLVQTSKQLVGIVKPILYHHVIITDKVQRDLLGNVSEEDAKLVKKLVIRGFESVDLVREGEDDYYWERKDNIGPGCIRDLLEGKLLDLSCELLASLAYSQSFVADSAD